MQITKLSSVRYSVPVACPVTGKLKDKFTSPEYDIVDLGDGLRTEVSYRGVSIRHNVPWHSGVIVPDVAEEEPAPVIEEITVPDPVIDDRPQKSRGRPPGAKAKTGPAR